MVHSLVPDKGFCWTPWALFDINNFWRLALGLANRTYSMTIFFRIFRRQKHIFYFKMLMLVSKMKSYIVNILKQTMNKGADR